VTIIVFAKVPRAGSVKTRLSPPFTPEQAAAFYGAMLSDVLDTTGGIAQALGLAPVVAIHPWEQRGELARLVPKAFRMVPQRGSNLGARMERAVGEAAAAGHRRILVRGSDNPTLGRDAVSAALETLAERELVLQPDADGGYGLVGLRDPCPGLFDHPMSTRGVLEATLENARRHGLCAHVGDSGFDIDVAGDLRRLADLERRALSATCSRTLAFLDENALWPPGS